eukprot:471823_1
MVSVSWTSCVEAAISSVITIHHTILIATTLLQNKKEFKSTLFRIVMPVLLFNLFLALTNSVIIILDIFMDLNQHIFGLCWILFSIMLTIYTAAKLSLWYYYVSRLEILFIANPSLNYHPTLVKSLKIMCFVTPIFVLTMLLLGMVPLHNSEGQCVLSFRLWVYAAVIFPDTIMNSLCYYLFHRKMTMLTKLYQLTQLQHNSNETKSTKQSEMKLNPQLLYVLRKFTILCAATIVSTWIGGGISIIDPSTTVIVASFDSVINVWCILLYDCRYDYIYLKVFGCVAKREWSATDKTATKNAASPDPNSVQVIIT